MADYWDKLQQTWPARAAQGLWEGLLAPGRALQSTEPMTSEQMIAPAFNMAGLMMGGGVAGTGEGAGAALGSGAVRSNRMVDNADIFKELANQRRTAGMSVGKSAEGWDFKRPQPEKGSWEDLFARTKAGWEGDKARAISEYEQSAPGAVPRSPYMSDADYAEVAKPTFTLGSGATDKKTAGLVQGIRAYHGSPHDFDAFDLSKIGTGEGAQAYGHGLYFAEHEPVAKEYRDVLTRRGVNDADISPTVTGNALFDIAAKNGDLINGKMPFGSSRSLMTRDDIVNGFEQGKFSPFDLTPAMQRQIVDHIKPKGHMYEVNINADPAHFLDWDKPLSQQPQSVQDALAKIASEAPEPKSGPARRNRAAILAGDGTVPGDVLYNNLGGFSQPGQTSQALREAGIPGIKYLDQGSRPPSAAELSKARSVLAGAEMNGDPAWIAKQQANVARLEALMTKPPTSNYVVFNDKLIDILKKYAMAGTLGAPFFGTGNNGQQSQ